MNPGRALALRFSIAIAMLYCGGTLNLPHGAFLKFPEDRLAKLEQSALVSGLARARSLSVTSFL